MDDEYLNYADIIGYYRCFISLLLTTDNGLRTSPDFMPEEEKRDR